MIKEIKFIQPDQGGNKVVTIETGAQITVPLFVNQDDIILINTQTGEYVERAEKG